MAIKIEMLRCFAVVARTGNLSEAANQLGRTQSAVSMTLKKLEENLGKRLFERDRKNRLSPFGEQVFELARTQLRQFDYTMKSIESLAKSPKGLVRVASIPSVAGVVFPTTIDALTRRYPGLNVELRDSDTSQVVDALLRGQADIGIVSGEHRLNGIHQAHLFSDQFGLICSPDHPLARQETEPVISQISASEFIRNNLCDQIGNPAFRAAISRSNVSIHNTMSLVAMARTGNWITVLPKTVVQSMSAELVFRGISDLPEQRRVCVLMPERTPFPEFTQEVWDILTGFDWKRATGENAARPDQRSP